MAERRKNDNKFLKRNKSGEWRNKLEKEPMKQEWRNIKKDIKKMNKAFSIDALSEH